MPADANVSISQDDSKSHLKLHCDKNFILRDENALFQSMGLRRPNDSELVKIFGEEMTEFLTTQRLIDLPP